ncbi:MAG: U32 family peptidase [Erysipelotrichaceae bacterium]|nr:U32 family peptidase [Erysipelotrichaceae bacterium]
MEILSPCGSMDSFYAAIEGGCDAVYLAGKMFGARSFANNFTNEELVYVINYAHLYGVKVYITCNILVLEREVSKFLEFISFLHRNNVDAVIMQDLGMIDLVHKKFPNLEIHASTQMHIHNLDGALMAKKLGIKRIVLARETPLEEIIKIKKYSGLEVEVFVHGALCVSYSGNCLFARSIGPRSGNRGTCTGCCRLPYKVLDEKYNVLNKGDYPLSMKDLETIYNLDKLIDAGIDSFKIEGRMKSPSYVYLATKLYKDTLTNYLKAKTLKVDLKTLHDLKTCFTRNTTNGFIFNETNNIDDMSSNHLGVLIGKVILEKNNYVSIKLFDKVSIHDGLRIKDEYEYGLTLNEFRVNNKQVYEAYKNDIITFKVNKKINVDSLVYKTLSYEIDNNILKIIKERIRKIPIKMTCNISLNKEIELIISDNYNTIKVYGEKPSLATKKELTISLVSDKLKKINDTIYKIDNIEINLDKSLFLPISSLNNLRREGIDKLNEARLLKYKKEIVDGTYEISLIDYKKEREFSYLKDDNYSYLSKTIKRIPRVVFDYNKYKDNLYLVGELGALNKFKSFITDYSFNVFNSYTVALLNSLGALRITLSLELSKKDIEDLVIAYKNRYLKNPNLEVVYKSRWCLMVLKTNFNKIYPGSKYLVDRFNNKYLIVNKDNLTYIYDYKITTINNYQELFDLGVNYLREEL